MPAASTSENAPSAAVVTGSIELPRFHSPAVETRALPTGLPASSRTWPVTAMPAWSTRSIRPVEFAEPTLVNPRVRREAFRGRVNADPAGMDRADVALPSAPVFAVTPSSSSTLTSAFAIGLC